ncbi:hypothetical protein QR97_02160 [Streptomyces sp. PBH53]|uniref:hypothetical protein n=1 Tax=Streptomyces sp. PBH53 TaxID=1577075 RepID=UPI000655F5C8|nr:hypothetical protein [Streptomyces sp. PBH53]AKN68765.1 hypothetical protein QR97_02160 [Streptomyces sp. PBH53]
MTTRTSKAASEPQDTTEIKTVLGTAGPRAQLETITLSHHLNIEGTDYLPGSKIRVPSDYARRLRRQGYVARS